MFAIGLILIILAIIVVVYVIFATSGLEPMSIDWGVFTADLTPLQLFFLGAVTILVLALGSVLLSIGLKSQGEKRAEVKRLRKEVKQTHSGEGAKGDKVAHATTESSRDRSEASSKSSSTSDSSARTGRDAHGRGTKGSDTAERDSAGGDSRTRDSSSRDSSSRESRGLDGDRDKGGNSDVRGSEQTQNTKIPPPVPPRDSTPPPPRSSER